MLKAYIDDSRMNQPTLYSLGGWVAPTEKWALFSDAWRDILWMHPNFLDDKQFVALQAADLHAGWARIRNELMLDDGADPEPI
jgi:hypothetical protein